MKKAFGIIVGGGPAPGINGVISAATIEAIKNGHKVFGIKHSFKGIASGDLNCIQELGIEDVSGIHSEGGSILPISRSNPGEQPKMMENILSILSEKNIAYLIPILFPGIWFYIFYILRKICKAWWRFAFILTPKTSWQGI